MMKGKVTQIVTFYTKSHDNNLLRFYVFVSNDNKAFTEIDLRITYIIFIAVTPFTLNIDSKDPSLFVRGGTDSV